MAVFGAGDPKQKADAATTDDGGDPLQQQVPGKGNRNGHYSSSLGEHMQTEDAASSSAYYYDSSNNCQSSPSSSTCTAQEGTMLGLGGVDGDVEQQRRRNNNAAAAGPSSSSSRRFMIRAVASLAGKRREIDWGSLWERCKEWVRKPMNMALLVWIVAVGVSGAILFMVMTGMLNRVLPRKAQKDTWFEVNNQILNALFTLMCLYQHPRRLHHLALLCRWSAGDMLLLRQAYCRGGTCKPGERRHMAVVVVLLHLNCVAQYALCGLNLGYTRAKRPVVGVALTMSVAIGAPAVAGLYSNLSPLGKDYEAQAAEDDEESAIAGSSNNNNNYLQRKTRSSSTDHGGGDDESTSMSRGRMQWAGGLWDVWDDLPLAYLSLLCSCCVFGWNMGRLGLGNTYVHVVTFLLFCLAPFFIFDLAAVNIDSEAAREALGIAGIFLCVLGLLYGGFWRIHMRRRLGLPANGACCGKPDLTDCLLWLCCYSCSLAQEVRTADAFLLFQQQEQDQLQHHPSSAVYEYRRRDDHDDSSSSSSSSQMQMQHHPTLQEELSTMQQPLRGVVFPASSAAVSVKDGVTVPPSLSVMHTYMQNHQN